MIKQYVCRVGGNLLRVCDHAQKFVKSFFPSQILEVSHYIHGSSELVYCAKSFLSRWTTAFCTNMYLPHEGYYRLRVWNANTCTYQSFFLSSQHLDKALSSRNLFSWWAMTDFGIITMVSSYVSMMQATNTYVIGILINGEDATHILKPYFSSICLARNCTAQSLCSLYHDITGIHPKKTDKAEVTIIDYDMMEHKKVNDEFMFE